MSHPFAKAMRDTLDALDGSAKLLQKSLKTTDFTASNTLGTEEADVFISEVVAESVIFSNATIWRTSKPSGQISFYDLPGYIVESVAEDTDTSNVFNPTFRRVAFATRKIRAAIDVTSESLEDNIEGPAFQAKLMSDVIRQVSNNFETLAWVGDSAQGGTDSYSRLIKTNDGWLKQLGASSGAALVNGNGKRMSFALLDKMFAALPHKYKSPQYLSKLRWIISWGSALALVTDGATRATNLGDQLRTTGSLPLVHGIPFLICPLFPEDQSISGTASLGSEVLLCDPKNLTMVMQRDISSEWERKPRQDRWEGTLYARNDFVIMDPAGVVRAYDVSVDPAVNLYNV